MSLWHLLPMLVQLLTGYHKTCQTSRHLRLNFHKLPSLYQWSLVPCTCHKNLEIQIKMHGKSKPIVTIVAKKVISGLIACCSNDMNNKELCRTHRLHRRLNSLQQRKTVVSSKMQTVTSVQSIILMLWKLSWLLWKQKLKN